MGVDGAARVGAAVELAVDFCRNSWDDFHDIVSYPSFQWNSTGIWMAGELLSPAVLAGEKAVAGAEQQTKLLEGETLPSEVREEVASFIVLADLTAGCQVWNLWEGGEEVVLLHQAI